MKERHSVFISAMMPDHSSLLRTIAAEAKRDRIPIIRSETVSFLQTMVAAKHPKRILEIGTATGYSAIAMAEVMPKGCTITTIENYEKRIPLTKENFCRASLSDRIALLEGDAALVLKTLTGQYDFIFMDAAKGQYLSFLPELLRLMPLGGILISDNIFMGKEVLNSRYAVTRRDRTIHARMREYVKTLTHSSCLTTSIIPLGDGLTISVKVGDASVKTDDTDMEIDDTNVEIDDTKVEIDATSVKLDVTSVEIDDTNMEIDDSSVKIRSV